MSPSMRFLATNEALSWLHTSTPTQLQFKAQRETTREEYEPLRKNTFGEFLWAVIVVVGILLWLVDW